MSRWLIVMAAALGSLKPPAAAEAQGTPRAATPVEVVGEGRTRWEARSAAIQLALQQVVAQLVVADRAVAGDSLVRDEVISTMNGFVERFEVLAEESLPDKTIRMTARVHVAESNIQTFIGAQRSMAGSVDGDLLLAQLQATQLAEQHRAQIVTRLFEGFPHLAVELTPVTVTPDSRDREQVQVSVAVQIDSLFVRQLVGGMEALGRTCGAPNCQGKFRLALPSAEGRGKSYEIHGVDSRLMSRLRDRLVCAGGCSTLTAIAFTERRLRHVKVNYDLSVARRAATCRDQSGDAARGEYNDEVVVREERSGRYAYWVTRNLYGFREPSPVYANYCLATGDRRGTFSVPIAFLEGARQMRVVLRPDECKPGRSSSGQYIDRSESPPCLNALAQVTGIKWARGRDQRGRPSSEEFWRT